MYTQNRNQPTKKNQQQQQQTLHEHNYEYVCLYSKYIDKDMASVENDEQKKECLVEILLGLLDILNLSSLHGSNYFELAI